MNSSGYVKESLTSIGISLYFRKFGANDPAIQQFLKDNSLKVRNDKEKFVHARKVIKMVVVDDIESLIDFDPTEINANSRYLLFLEEVYLLAIKNNPFLRHADAADEQGSGTESGGGFKSPYGDIFKIQNSLKEKIIGQDFVIDELCKELIKREIGLHNPTKPPSYILLGQTGTGKTYFVEQLTEALYGDRDRLLKINCSKYGQPHEVANLIGSPKGYVGSQEKGIFYRHLQKYTDAIVLFDEIEKAHDKLFELLLPITDKGEIEDNDGHVLNFDKTIIFFTSNLGAHGNIRKDFEGYVDLGDPALTGQKALYRDQVQMALNLCFSPEFLNRIKDVICFNSLSQKDISRILKIELRKISERLERNAITFELSEGAAKRLSQECFSEVYGARELERTVDRFITNPLAEAIYKREMERGDDILIEHSGETFVFTKASSVKKPKAKDPGEPVKKSKAKDPGETVKKPDSKSSASTSRAEKRRKSN